MTSLDADDNVVTERRRPFIRRLADNLVITLFFAPVMLAALPMGSSRDWAWAPIAVVVGLVSILVAAGLGVRRGFEIGELERRPLLALVGCFLFVIVFALFQGASFAPASGSAWLYASALRILGAAHAAVPDISLDAARNGLLKCITCGLVFLMARAICRERSLARALLAVVVASTLLVVVYALIMQVTTHSCYLGSYLKKQGVYDPRGQCLMSGTFVNSNSYACYVGMGVVAAMGLALSGRPREHTAFDGRDVQTFESMMTITRVGLVVAILFLLGGLLMSASRAGVAASVGGALALVLLLMRGQWGERPDLVRFFWVGMAIVMVVGVIAGGALLAKSVRATDGGTRLIIWMTSLDAIGLSPWLGWGLGGFPDIYTILQPASIVQPNDLAHSTPLETIVELGVIAGIPAFAVVLLPWGFSLRAALRRQYRHKVLPAAAFAIAAVPILHSMVDFSLQIPSIAFVTSAVLGMGWGQAFDRRRSSSRRRTTG